MKMKLVNLSALLLVLSCSAYCDDSTVADSAKQSSLKTTEKRGLTETGSPALTYTQGNGASSQSGGHAQEPYGTASTPAAAITYSQAPTKATASIQGYGSKTSASPIIYATAQPQSKAGYAAPQAQAQIAYAPHGAPQHYAGQLFTKVNLIPAIDLAKLGYGGQQGYTGQAYAVAPQHGGYAAAPAQGYTVAAPHQPGYAAQGYAAPQGHQGYAAQAYAVPQGYVGQHAGYSSAQPQTYILTAAPASGGYAGAPTHQGGAVAYAAPVPIGKAGGAATQYYATPVAYAGKAAPQQYYAAPVGYTGYAGKASGATQYYAQPIGYAGRTIAAAQYYATPVAYAGKAAGAAPAAQYYAAAGYDGSQGQTAAPKVAYAQPALIQPAYAHQAALPKASTGHGQGSGAVSYASFSQGLTGGAGAQHKAAPAPLQYTPAAAVAKVAYVPQVAYSQLSSGGYSQPASGGGYALYSSPQGHIYAMPRGSQLYAAYDNHGAAAPHQQAIYSSAPQQAIYQSPSSGHLAYSSAPGGKAQGVAYQAQPAAPAQAGGHVQYTSAPQLSYAKLAGYPQIAYHSH